jgi:hypothetical protein
MTGKKKQKVSQEMLAVAETCRKCGPQAIYERQET